MKLDNFTKALIAAALFFAVIYFLDWAFFFEDNIRGSRDLLRFYFSPLMLVLDFLNLILPIEITLIYGIVLYPRGLGYGEFIVGYLWTFLLSYVYFRFFKQSWVIFVGWVIFGCLISYFLLDWIFGPAWFRYCPRCI